MTKPLNREYHLEIIYRDEEYIQYSVKIIEKDIKNIIRSQEWIDKYAEKHGAKKTAEYMEENYLNKVDGITNGTTIIVLEKKEKDNGRKKRNSNVRKRGKILKLRSQNGKKQNIG